MVRPCPRQAAAPHRGRRRGPGTPESSREVVTMAPIVRSLGFYRKLIACFRNSEYLFAWDFFIAPRPWLEIFQQKVYKHSWELATVLGILGRLADFQVPSHGGSDSQTFTITYVKVTSGASEWIAGKLLTHITESALFFFFLVSLLFLFHSHCKLVHVTSSLSFLNIRFWNNCVFNRRVC